MKINELINLGSNKLKFNNVPSYQLDSEILLSKVLGKRREEIIVNLDKSVKDNDIFNFKQLIQRRSKKEPIAYIIREKEFWSLKFEVNKNTLIPRPETELIIDYLSNLYKDKKINILDVGTGSGCILISLISELKNSRGLGIDISQKALTIASKNSIKHHIESKVKFIKRSINDIYGIKFNLIVSNPPYINKRDIKNLSEDIRKYEPLIALDGGNDGLDLIKKIIYKAKYLLKVNGKLALEISNEQKIKVSEILKKNSFREEHIIKDYKNNYRYLISSLQ